MSDRRIESRDDHERLWSAVEEIKARMSVIETKFESIEELISNQHKFCQMEVNRWDTISNHLRQHENKIMERFSGIEKSIENMAYRLNFIESTPGKIIVFVVGLVAIGGGLWAVIRHWLKSEIMR